MKHNELFIGCIADDFTGASDAASFLVKGGLHTALLSGCPTAGYQPAPAVQAAVIALKTRTQETKAAVADSLQALKWLADQGVRQLYIKYCSTFDSTPAGNIGPIADAALAAFDQPYTLLCPALPVNGRTVRNGILYVNGVPIHESPMKDHPLTPIWASEIAALMRPQSQYDCRSLSRADLTAAVPPGESPLPENCRYLIPDHETAADAAAIVRRYGRLRLLTGGSGLLEALAGQYAGDRATGSPATRSKPARDRSARTLILAGSCSPATLAQIGYYQRRGLPSYRLVPEKLLQNHQNSATAWAAAAAAGDTCLIYSSDTAVNVKAAQRSGKARVAAVIETTLADLAARAVRAGYTALIVAGGETAGAVTKRLGYRTFTVGASLAPGVPILQPEAAPGLRLVLKSGNFGGEDFFIKARAYLR